MLQRYEKNEAHDDWDCVSWMKEISYLCCMDTYNIKEAIIEQIKTVYDPEIPINIYELGLIYDVNVSEEGHAHILMTLTAPACPAAEILPEEVTQKAKGVQGVEDAEVELTFDPPWSKEMMSEEAMLELGFL